MSDSITTAIDVPYQTEIAIEAKSTEQLTIEANVEYKQAESLAAMSLTMLASVGRKIKEIKERIPYGSFEDWCKENLVFSKRQAEQYMKLASKIDDENSIFSKTQTFADVGISRVWALLAAPEEVAAEVIENNNIEDMTVRELNEEIKRLKNEKKQIESHEANMEKEISSLQRKLADSVTEADFEAIKEKMETEHAERMKSLRAEADSLAAANRAAAAKIQETKEKLKKAKQKLKDAEAAKDEEVQKRLEVAAAELEEKHADDIQKAKAEGAADAAASLGQMSEEISYLEAQIEKLEAEKAKLSNTSLMEFKVMVDQLQDVYFKINDLITEQNERDPELGLKMQNALKKLIEGWKP